MTVTHGVTRVFEKNSRTCGGGLPEARWYCTWKAWVLVPLIPVKMPVRPLAPVVRSVFGWNANRAW